jgi:serine phosphatase RsbU (regulator of sigma subunit)/anti-sigma regulatory factor (Ser/Thr protein kinase)
MTEMTHERRPAKRLHVITLVVLAVGIALSVGLSIGAARSIEDGQSKFLKSDLSQVASALEASVPSIQQPLVAGARIASSAGVAPFRAYESTEVGRGAPFRSVSLWRHERGSLTLVTVVGAPPEVLHGNEAVVTRMQALEPGERLGVLGLVVDPTRSLAFAELLPGTRLLVYAEDPLPRGSAAQSAIGSPFAGLHFELFLGADQVRSKLIETDLPHGVDGRSSAATVPYGSSSVTIVAVLTSNPPGLLPAPLPRGIAAGGLALTALATLTAERLVRRRERAELVATDTGQRYDELRGISETLQHSLLPPEEVLFPGIAIAGAYVAGVRPLGVGGDWYDAIPIDDEHLFVSVGDVAGRGHRAATVMSSLRHAIRAYAVQGDSPGEVLRKLNDLVDVDRDDCFATVLAALVDVPSRTLEVVSAGHLPPLLVDEAGARYLSLNVSLPVGLVGEWSVPIATRVALSTGSALVFYTDGLVERRGSVVDEGLDRLQQHVASEVGLGAPELVATIFHEVVPEEGGDDIAVLVLRWPSAVDAGPTHLVRSPSKRSMVGEDSSRQSFEGDAASVGLARAFVSERLAEKSQKIREVTTLLTSELASNAVLHARSAFDVCIKVAEAQVRVEVTDRGDGGVPLAPTRGKVAEGHGLWILSQLSDRWGVEQDADGANVVWFEVAADARVSDS